MALLPFEPRRPTLDVAGLHTTLLEATVAAASLALLWLCRERLRELWARPPLPLLLLAGYAAAHLASAGLAEAYRTQALKFALRMTAMVLFAVAIAATPSRAQRAGLLALAGAAALAAGLAVAEASRLPGVDRVLDLFRETSFNVGGVRRASAGSEYPNLGAACLMYGLVAGAGLWPVGRRWRGTFLCWSLLLSVGLLFTYSRGALMASGAGLLTLALARAREGRARVWVTAAALGTLVVVAATFAWRGEIVRLRLGSEGMARWYAADYAPDEDMLSMAPGQLCDTLVRVTNTGRRPWTIREGFRLSYHWYDAGGRPIGDGPRTLLPHDVEPGATVLLQALVHAPPAEGWYALRWDMVHEHTTWFSDEGVPSATVAVAVSSGPELAAVPAVRPAPWTPPWRPSRGELWGLALGMWHEHPWLGVGPDNYRRLYGPRSGHAVWDDRVFANNTLLEAAATTGSFGALALAGALIASVLAAWRALPAALPHERALAETLLGLLAGLAAHGMVDYVLAFTGHYLFFGFVVGAVSGLSLTRSPPERPGFGRDAS
jgi:O-antigen ligase